MSRDKISDYLPSDMITTEMAVSLDLTRCTVFLYITRKNINTITCLYFCSVAICNKCFIFSKKRKSK